MVERVDDGAEHLTALNRAAAGVNTGIMLARNDKGWSEEFWGDIARVSRINQEVPLGENSPEGRIKVHTTFFCVVGPRPLGIGFSSNLRRCSFSTGAWSGTTIRSLNP